MFASFAPVLQSLKASAADLGAKYCETTNAYVAAGLDQAVATTKSALLSSGVADASAAAVALADRTVEASGVVGLTRKAVAAVGRAVDATAAAAERTGAADLSYRVSEASAAALAPAVAISQRAYGATVDATVAAADATLSGTLKAVAITGRAAEVLPQAVDIMGIKEELKELTQDSNERMLAALYPGWSGDTSGCALLLCAIESSWTAVAARQAPQQASAAYADAAAARVAAAASTRRDAWRPLEMELARLPELTVGMQEAGAMAGRLLSRCEALSAAMDAAEAAAWAAPLAAREASAVRAAAAAESRHASDLALLRAEGEKRRRWAASRAAMEAAARVAPGVLPRRLRVGPAAHGRALAHVEVDLEEATASLRSFLDAPAAEARDGDARAPRRRHKERGAEGERRPSDGSERRRRHRAKSGKELDYLDYKGARTYAPPSSKTVPEPQQTGYQDPVSLAVLGGDDAAELVPHASPPHPILHAHEMPGAPPVSGVPPDLLSSENEAAASEGGGAAASRSAAAPAGAAESTGDSSSDDGGKR